jgi:hypothetical protein
MCLAKRSYTCEMNDLATKLDSDFSDEFLALIVSLRLRLRSSSFSALNLAEKRWRLVLRSRRNLPACLANIKSAFEINRIQRDRVESCMDEIQP